MNKKRFKIPQKTFLIAVTLLAVVTLLVVFATSYFATDKNNIPDNNRLPAIPTPEVATPTPVPVDDTDNDINEPEPQIEETIISINETNPGLKYSLDFFTAKSRAVAASVAVFDADVQNFYVYQYGFRDRSIQAPVDADTVFCVASLSKLVTVICAMTLVDDGLLDIDKDISEYLEFEIRNPRFPETKVTTRMLMQHTSSLAFISADDYFSLENLDRTETIQKLLQSRSTWDVWEPGTKYDYSAWLAHSLIALICEKLSGQRFDDFARSRLFEPLGINAAYLASNLQDIGNIAVHYNFYDQSIVYTPEDLLLADFKARVSDHERAGAHLMINALDYARILVMLGNGGVVNETRILSEKSIWEITNANIEGDYYMQGLSTRYESEPDRLFAGYYWHAGGAWGVSSHYIHRFDENTNHGVVVIITGIINDPFPRSTALDLTALAMQVLNAGNPE